MNDDQEPVPQREAAMAHSVRDGAAHAVMTGAGENYLSAFALFLRATEPQVAFLATFPQLFGAFMQVLSVRLRDHGVDRRRLILWPALGQALMWLPMPALVLLQGNHAVELLIVLVVAYFGLGSMIAPQWNSVMRDLVPLNVRARYFSHRTRLTTLASFVALLVAGFTLDALTIWQSTALGFTLLFVAAATARLVSVHHLSRMLPCTPDQQPLASTRGRLLIPFWRGEDRRSMFGRFLMFQASFQFAVAVSAPLFAVHMLRDLKFSFIEFTLVTGASVASQFLTLNAWGRVADAFGNRLILRASAWFIPTLPVLWLVSDSVAWLILVQLLGGFAWGGFNLSATGFQFDLGHGRDIGRQIATYNLVIALTSFAGALFGGWFAFLVPSWETSDWMTSFEFPLLGVFLLSGILRLATVMYWLPHLPEVRATRRPSVQRVVFRFTRYSAISGVVCDVISLVRRNPGGNTPGERPQPAEA